MRGLVRIRERIRRRACAIQERAARLDVAIHLRELVAHALEFADRAAERRAIARVFHRFLERAFGEAERDAGVQAALRVERVQSLRKPSS
jgi:hypothetical protein